MAEGFGDNVAAKANQESTYFINISDGGIVGEENHSTNQHNNNTTTTSTLKITSSIGSFQLTQASRLTARAIAETDLYGTVVDWGCGGGVLALLAASQAKVERVIGLDYEQANIDTCLYNARQNGLKKNNKRIEFYRSDSFEPFDESTKQVMCSLKDQVDFVIANPPASSDDDGFSFRRRILREAMPYLKPNARILLQALSYYGPHRFEKAGKAATELWEHTNPSIPMAYKYLGVIKSSPWMELGAGPGGYDFRNQIQQYCQEEKSGGLRYYCGYPSGKAEEGDIERQLSAIQAMSLWEEKQLTPLCQWHVHALQWAPEKP